MITEALGVFACLAVLWTMGIGPALWLNTRNPSRLAYSVAMAPAIGYALMGLLAFPLVRFVAPAHVWTYPVTALIIVLSLALAARDGRQHLSEFRQLISSRAALAVIGLTLLVLAVLVSPPVLRGIQYSIYRSNQHDAFLYMSFAETLRAVDWHTLQAGASLTSANLNNIARLAEMSPTALFTARQVELPLILNKMAFLAWTAELTQTPVPLFYYAHHVLAYAVAWPLVPLLGQQLQLPRWQLWLTAAAVTLGFWARFVLESDAGYEITVIPITLLFVLAWMLLDEERGPAIYSARWLLALAGAALLALCLPVALIVAVGFVAYCGLGLVQRRLPVGAIGRHVYTGGMILLLLGLSGQLDFQLQGAINLFKRSANERAFSAPAFDLIEHDGLAALWGLPGSILWAGRSLWVKWPLEQMAAGAGLLLSITLAVGLLAGLRPRAPATERRLFALLAGAGILAGVLLVTNNDRAAGKTFTYIYPLAILGVAAASRYLHAYLTGHGLRLAMAGLGAWMAAQAVIGVYLPLRRSPDFLGGSNKPEQYDLSAITRRLDAEPPGLVAVDVPRSDTWMFAYYSMFIFSRYPVHFISGLVIDNGTLYQNMWLSALSGPPRYSVVLKSADQIGPRGLGVILVETRDLRLYRIDGTDPGPFLQAEAAYREIEASKPPFPTLEASP